MGEHNAIQHVWEHKEGREVTYGGRTVRLTVRRCGCGSQWYWTDDGEEWQEDRQGLRRPAPPMWKRMEAEREEVDEHWERMEIARRQQRQLEPVLKTLFEVENGPLPALATVDLQLGRRHPREAGVWDDDWWHYELREGEILIFHLDPERRGLPVWRFPAGDVPYAASA